MQLQLIIRWFSWSLRRHRNCTMQCLTATVPEQWQKILHRPVSRRGKRLRQESSQNRIISAMQYLLRWADRMHRQTAERLRALAGILAMQLQMEFPVKKMKSVRQSHRLWVQMVYRPEADLKHWEIRFLLELHLELQHSKLRFLRLLQM